MTWIVKMKNGSVCRQMKRLIKRGLFSVLLAQISVWNLV